MRKRSAIRVDLARRELITLSPRAAKSLLRGTGGLRRRRPARPFALKMGVKRCARARRARLSEARPPRPRVAFHARAVRDARDAVPHGHVAPNLVPVKVATRSSGHDKRSALAPRACVSPWSSAVPSVRYGCVGATRPLLRCPLAGGQAPLARHGGSTQIACVFLVSKFVSVLH